jgi:CsoR family transcriptional regulator, copper-sensing transcriptional repressor
MTTLMLTAYSSIVPRAAATTTGLTLDKAGAVPAVPYPTPDGVGYAGPMRCCNEQELTAKKHAALNRLKTVRGHLDGIIRMLESDAYCVDVMKQISAVQSSLERANRVMLHNHLETCFSAAVLDGHGEAAIDELIDALKFTPALTGPQAQLSAVAVGEPADEAPAVEGA